MKVSKHGLYVEPLALSPIVRHQAEVLAMMLEGLSHTEIGSTLKLSRAQCKRIACTIFRLLGVPNKGDLLILARAHDRAFYEAQIAALGAEPRTPAIVTVQSDKPTSNRKRTRDHIFGEEPTDR